MVGTYNCVSSGIYSSWAPKEVIRSKFMDYKLHDDCEFRPDCGLHPSLLEPCLSCLWFRKHHSKQAGHNVGTPERHPVLPDRLKSSILLKAKPLILPAAIRSQAGHRSAEKSNMVGSTRLGTSSVHQPTVASPAQLEGLRWEHKSERGKKSELRRNQKEWVRSASNVERRHQATRFAQGREQARCAVRTK